jgi:hypothetical protein
VGRRLARIVGDAHAAIDAEGNLAPVIHGRLGPAAVIVEADGEIRVEASDPRVEGSALAPEIARGGRLTPRADVYGLGAIARTLLVAGDVGPLGTARPDLPEAVAAAIDRALEPDPSRRRITAVELEAWLASLDPHDVGRRELAALVARLTAPPRRTRDPRPAREEPLSPLASACVALATAAVVFAAGALVAEHLVAARPDPAGSSARSP